MGWPVAKIGDRWAALEPVHQGRRHAYGGGLYTKMPTVIGGSCRLPPSQSRLFRVTSTLNRPTETPKSVIIGITTT